jgi:hypothetical protein
MGVTATAHKLARVVYHLVRYGAAYVRQTEAAYAEQVRARVERSFHRRAVLGLGKYCVFFLRESQDDCCYCFTQPVYLPSGG